MSTPDLYSDEYFMDQALDEARAAALRGEVPIGCIVVYNNDIVARSSNRLEELQQATAHAEVMAIDMASQVRGSRRLINCCLYVTLEPCAMCAGAIVNARIPRVVFAARDPKAGAVRSLYELCNDERLNHRCEVVEGIRAEESAELLQDFFRELRRSKKESGTLEDES